LLAVGVMVDRELDDFANIWATARITAVRADDSCVDLEYEDGCTETDVSIWELRPHMISEAVTKVEQATGPCAEPSENDLAAPVPGGEVLVVPSRPRGGLSTTLTRLRSETDRLGENVCCLHHTEAHVLGRLGVVSAALLQSALSLRLPVLSLGRLTLSLRRQAQPVFSDLAGPSSGEQTASTEQTKLGNLTYMLPIEVKHRRPLGDVSAFRSLSKSSSSPVVGSPSRSLLRRSGTHKLSAMMLDLGVEDVSAPCVAPAGLSPSAPLSKGLLVAKKLQSIKSGSSLEALSPVSQKAPLWLPSLTDKPQRAAVRPLVRGTSSMSLSSGRCPVF